MQRMWTAYRQERDGVRDNGHRGGLDKFRLHGRCFAAWEFERRNGDGMTTPEEVFKRSREQCDAAARMRAVAQAMLAKAGQMIEKALAARILVTMHLAA
jgi:hypothetical protein